MSKSSEFSTRDRIDKFYFEIIYEKFSFFNIRTQLPCDRYSPEDIGFRSNEYELTIGESSENVTKADMHHTTDLVLPTVSPDNLYSMVLKEEAAIDNVGNPNQLLTPENAQQLVDATTFSANDSTNVIAEASVTAV